MAGSAPRSGAKVTARENVLGNSRAKLVAMTKTFKWLPPGKGDMIFLSFPLIGGARSDHDGTKKRNRQGIQHGFEE